MGTQSRQSSFRGVPCGLCVANVSNPAQRSFVLQEKKDLEESISKMKHAVLRVVADSPEIRGKLWLLFNSTTVIWNEQGQEVGGGRVDQEARDKKSEQETGKGVANEGRVDDELLSDKVMDTLVNDLSKFMVFSVLCCQHAIVSFIVFL